MVVETSKHTFTTRNNRQMTVLPSLYASVWPKGMFWSLLRREAMKDPDSLYDLINLPAASWSFVDVSFVKVPAPSV